MLKDSRKWTEAVADIFTRGLEIATLSVVDDDYSESFVRYVHGFVAYVWNLPSNGRNMLLLYSGYRSRMDIGALEILRSGVIITYALLVHTSGSMLPFNLA